MTLTVMPDQDLVISQLSKEFGYLPYMINRYLQFLGLDGTISLLKANEKPLLPTIRVNTLKITKEELLERLIRKGFVCEPIENIPYALKILLSPSSIGSQHEYLQGYYYVQNIASMLPAIMLDPNPNDLIIDMCAAPGSKSTQLAQLMQNEGNLILIERNKNRIPALKVNINRMGIINSVILNFDAKNLKTLKIEAYKVLLDAPCTGEGLIREDPSRKKSRRFNQIKKMAKIQSNLLKAGLETLTIGGELLYSTCSIAPEENEIVINSTLEHLPNFSIVKMPFTFGIEGLIKFNGTALREDLVNAQRLYPHIHDTIGFFMCKIKRFY
jgi:NOL1/NOP2/sun family putative RNA methylase